MSVLNRTESGQPSILLALARALWARADHTMPKDELLSSIAPDALRDADKRAKRTLTCWQALGLFVESKAGEVGFARNLAKSQEPKTLGWLRVAAREVAFTDKNNSPLWPQKIARPANAKPDEEEGEAADLTRGIAWLLAQPQSVRLAAFPGAEALAQDQLGDARTMLPNNTRWSTLKDWMPFLGFSVGAPPPPKIAESSLIPDPTQAITDVLPLVFSGSSELPASEFLKRIAEELPVLDGGKFRVETEKHFLESHRPAHSKGQLSPTLSRALKRLDFERRIRLLKRSDAPEARLQFGAGGSQLFTHVAITRGKL